MEVTPGKKKVKHPRVIYSLAICATVGGLLFGYQTGIINGAILLIDEQYHLSDRWVESIVSSTVGSAAVFSLLSGTVSDAVGRKFIIMVSACVFTAGAAIMGFANGPMMILIGRLVVGASIGFVSSVVPVYVSECAPQDIRGRLITLNQLFITLGIVASAILAGALQGLGETGWRWMLGLAAIPGALQFVFFFSLPESPRYQVMKHQDKDAEETLRRIRGTDDVSEEMREIKDSLQEESESKGCRMWVKMFSTPHVRKALFIGCMLQLFQQFCGINTVIYYSATILKSAGFDSKMAIWLSCIPAGINFLATFIGLWAVESLGRKLILAFSFLAISVALFILCFGFAMAQAESPTTSSVHEMVAPIGPCYHYDTCYQCTKNAHCGFCYLTNNFNRPTDGSCVPVSEQTTRFALHGRCALNSTTNGFSDHKALFTYEFCPSVYAYFAVAGLVLFVLGFAPGAGPMPWTINAEIYPLWCRGVANSLSTVTNWTCNLVVSYTFLTLIDAITIWGTFLSFAGVSVLAAIFVFMAVPETKDKSLEEIQLLFMSKDEREEQMEKNLKRESSKIGLGQPVMIRPLTRPHSDGTTELL